MKANSVLRPAASTTRRTSWSARLARAGVIAAAALAFGAQAQPASAPGSAADMADGEIRKVDKETKKLTIKHGEIKNLDMPGMTMLFQVRDPALLDKVKAGDKIRFKAEKADSGYVVTAIELAK